MPDLTPKEIAGKIIDGSWPCGDGHKQLAAAYLELLKGGEREWRVRYEHQHYPHSQTWTETWHNASSESDAHDLSAALEGVRNIRIESRHPAGPWEAEKE